MDDFARIIRNADAHEDAMLEASQSTLDVWAEAATAWARQNRPWTDRTKRARLGLSFVRDYPDDVREGASVALVHGVIYGRFLETSNGGTYAIIGPTTATFEPLLLVDLQEIWHE